MKSRRGVRREWKTEGDRSEEKGGRGRRMMRGIGKKGDQRCESSTQESGLFRITCKKNKKRHDEFANGAVGQTGKARA